MGISWRSWFAGWNRRLLGAAEVSVFQGGGICRPQENQVFYAIIRCLHKIWETALTFQKDSGGDRSPPPVTLCVDQLVIYNLYCPVPDVVHLLHPLHLIVCFEFFGDAFLFGTPYVTVAFATPTKQQLNIILFIHISRYIFN